MSFSSLGFSNALAVLILRKRFAQPPSPVLLQQAISVGLKLALALFSLSWAYAFWIGAKAVVKALMNEDFIPLLFLFFSPLISLLFSWSLFGVSLRARSREVAELAEEIQALETTKTVSDDWSDAWRAREIEALRPQLAANPEHVNGWLQNWRTKCFQRFGWKALRTVLLLGKPSYREILSMLENNNREDIKRWSLVTGKTVPNWR
jgi:hypothetical protein